MSWPYRCTHDDCRRRRALRKPIDQYRRRPTCPACNRDSLRLDAWKKRDHRRALCRCSQGHWYPHRRGSYGCAHYTGPRRPDDTNWDRINADLGVRCSFQGAESAPF